MSKVDFDLQLPDINHLVFQSHTKMGAPIFDFERGDFAAKIVTEGYVRFTEQGEGPWTQLLLRFTSCLRSMSQEGYELYKPWKTSQLCDASIHVGGPEQFKEHEELINPLAKRLSLVALIMERVPDQLPDSYPEFNGRFPVGVAYALNHFLVNPKYGAAVLYSEYGFDIHHFADDPNNHDSLGKKFSEIGLQLKETLTRLTNVKNIKDETI